MKKIMTLIFGFVFMIGCTNSASVDNLNVDTVDDDFNYTSYLDGVDLKDMEEVGADADHFFDISDINKLKDFSGNVFVGTVDSIDGCSTTISSGEFNPMPQTYGKITILNNLKGDIIDKTIVFARSGGILTLAQYEKDAPIEIIENDNKHRIEMGMENINKENTYISIAYIDDISLEAGKTYLFFGVQNEKTKVFDIVGVEYGTREIIQTTTQVKAFRSMPEESTLTIKNNETGKYESLEQIIDTYFKD